MLAPELTKELKECFNNLQTLEKKLAQPKTDECFEFFCQHKFNKEKIEFIRKQVEEKFLNKDVSWFWGEHVKGFVWDRTVIRVMNYDDDVGTAYLSEAVRMMNRRYDST